MMKIVVQQGSGSCDTDKVAHAEGSLSRGAPVENLCPGLHPKQGFPLLGNRFEPAIRNKHNPGRYERETKQNDS